MNELRLNHAEFLVLLDAVNSTSVIGIAQEDLFPQEVEARRTILRQGQALLEQRELLKASHLHPELLAVARIIARPQIAMIIIRHVLGIGPQLFLLYQAQEGAVEQTFPEEQVHRLAVLPDVPFLLARAAQILSVPERASIKASVEVAQDAFIRANDLARKHLLGSAQEILQSAGMPFPEAQMLATTMQEPNFRGEAMLLKCANQAISDACDIIVIQDKWVAWCAMQVIPGQPRLLVRSVHERVLYNVLSHCFAEMAA